MVLKVRKKQDKGRNARVAQWWSIALPRRGSRVRIPSRAFFIGWNSLNFQGFRPFLFSEIFLKNIRYGRETGVIGHAI